MARMTIAERGRAIGMIEAGQSLRQVSRAFNRQFRTIQLLWTKYQQTGSVADRQRTPKTRVTTRRQDRYIVLDHLRHRFQPATVTARQTLGLHGRNVTPQTIRNRLREVGIKSRRPRKGLILLPRHRRDRLVWARRHMRFRQADWAQVLFVDETRIKLQMADGRMRVYRRRGERNSAECVVQEDRFGCGSIMFFAGISMHTKTQLVSVNGNLNALKYQNDILRPVVLPHIAANRGMLLAHDNAPCHAARTTRQLLTDNNVRVMNWPAKSPDLNPIEHMWDLLKRSIRQGPQPGNIRQLHQVATQAWTGIIQGTIQRYIRSMRSRCQAVIAANGGHTRY